MGKKKKKKKKDKKKDKRKEKKRKTSPEVKPLHGLNTTVYKEAKVGSTVVVYDCGTGLVDKKVISLGTGRRPFRGQTVTIIGSGHIAGSKTKFWNTRRQKGAAKEDSLPQAGAGPNEGGPNLEKIKKKHNLLTYRCGFTHPSICSGWDEGILSMRVGEKAMLTVSGDLAYGHKGKPEWAIPS